MGLLETSVRKQGKPCETKSLVANGNNAISQNPLPWRVTSPCLMQQLICKTNSLYVSDSTALDTQVEAWRDWSVLDF